MMLLKQNLGKMMVVTKVNSSYDAVTTDDDGGYN